MIYLTNTLFQNPSNIVLWELPSFFLIEHNDAIRGLISPNMQCQAAHLSRSENCMVGIGWTQQAARDEGVSAIVEHDTRIPLLPLVMNQLENEIYVTLMPVSSETLQDDN